MHLTANTALHTRLFIGCCVAVAGIAYVALVLVMIRRCFRAQDEAEQEARKWASFWGMKYGLLLTVPIVFALELLAFRNGGSAVGEWLVAVHLPPVLPVAFVTGVMAGVMAIVLPVSLGQIAARLLWWRKRR